jgi:hypothetical protein
MISWLIIGMIIIVALVFAKMRHIRHKFFIIAALLLIAFFYISASQVIGNQNLDLGTFDGVMAAGKLYFTWLVHIGGNAQQLAGNAIKMDWVGNITSGK